jgi:rifampicin phosphotransferase
LPHLMFVIDRAAQRDQVYFVNSRRYSFHGEFVNANYLSLERGAAFFKNNYLNAQRRFILGTIAYQPKLNQFTFEYWEGDLATAAIIRESYAALQSSFFAPLTFKPNAARQEEEAATINDLPRLKLGELNPARDYQPLHQAANAGVLRIVDRFTDDLIFDRNEIVIFGEAPLTLTPVSGVITTTMATPLAHVNLLAKGWGIPNAFIKNAAEKYAALAGKFVFFETRADGFTLRPATSNEAAERGRQLAKRSDLLTPAADLEWKELTELKAQRKTDVKRFGAKAANLGEVAQAVKRNAVRDITVPDGFSLPFFYYEQFLQENGFDNTILALLGDDRFNHDAAYRKEQLAALRAKLQSGKVNEAFARAVVARKHTLLGDAGVFVRSSTNAEDLPNFSGAGLYTTVPNVRDEAALLEAIKTVWASLWNFAAYEARESAGINHSAVYAAVLIQVGVKAEAAGVLITTNPFDKRDRASVYVNAQRGLGIRVVEGRRVPEQLLYQPKSQSVKVLTRSDDDTMLTFDERGGVREFKIETARAVLTDAVVKRLARAALQIQRVFRGAPQDIEWVTVGTQIFIVQSRPYVEKQ